MGDIFGSLSDDIVDLISRQIRQQDLSRLALVSKQFRSFATPLLYRTVGLSSAKQKQMNDTTNNIEANIIAHTREIEINDALDCTLLVDLLGRMNHLKKIRWSSWSEPIPGTVLCCLKDQWPDTHVYIENLCIGHNSERYEDDVAILKSISSCHNIRSIQTSIECFHSISAKAFKETLLSCPNLEVLGLQISRYTGINLQVLDDPPLGSVFDVKPGDTLAPLIELRYECDTHCPQEFMFPGSFFNFTKIRHIELYGPTMHCFVESIKTPITTLETLIIENFCRAEWHMEATRVLNNFLCNIHGLVTLKLVNSTVHQPKTTLLSIIAQQGESLKTLASYVPKRPDITYYLIIATEPFSSEDLDTIQKACPNLSSLALDLEDDEQKSPYEVLSALAQFSKLDTLRLYITGIRSDCAHLQTDTKTIHVLASYLARLKLGVPFKKIEVIIGGRHKEITGGEREPGTSERPDILFSCEVARDGHIALTEDSHMIRGTSWDAYLKADDECKLPGHDWLRDLEEWNRLAEEADSTMMGIVKETIDDGIESLFRSDIE